MRIVFLGSPEFALPALRRLLDSEHEIVAVFTQPDRPVGRGRRLAAPPVKRLAIERGIAVRQPASISRAESVAELQRIAPDLGVIAAYGQLLKQQVLDVPRLGFINVHASLLPRWRGAAPIAAAILVGDGETGATIMQVRLALDSGPMLASVRVPIGSDDTAGTLTARVAEAGAALLMDVLPGWESGTVAAVEQDDALATYAPQIRKSDALLDLARDDADTIARKVRAFNPWPGAFAYLHGAPLRILECHVTHAAPGAAAGTVFALASAGARPFAGGFGVIAREGAIAVTVVQPPGGRAMAAAEYVRGHRDVIGARLTGAAAGMSA
jgi:methionyl-tRNA formyltransferase